MNQVRIWGDPFGEDGTAILLRNFVRSCLGNGMRCALSLTCVKPGEVQAGERAVPLTDGVQNLQVGTRLPDSEVRLLMHVAADAVAATAPVVVFAPEEGLADAMRLAGLEWPRAAALLAGREGCTPGELLDRVRAELRWAGVGKVPHALPLHELEPWLALPPSGPNGAIVHVGAGPEDGTELVVEAWLRHCAGQGRGLRLVVGAADDGTVATLCKMVEGVHSAACEIVRAPFAPAHALDAAAIVLPYRLLRQSRVLVQAMASGRPVCISRWSATAPILGACGSCQPIGGQCVPQEGPVAAHFAPHPRALAAALQKAFDDPSVGRRGRRHVLEELVADAPAAPPAPLRATRKSRPMVVLEAPFFETSSSAELSIETARALLARGNVDLQLVPTLPLHGDLAGLRRRAPELEPLLVRTPGSVDLWLSAGWPVRAARPDCRVHALRVDWEYGALPLELTPHVTQEADAVVVHSEHVYRAVTAAGRPMPQVRVVPHGVDEAMHENAPPDPVVVQWKGDLPAVLFCGGLIWRKGIDVFLGAALAARAAGARFCIVVKSVGQSTHYSRHHLGELVRRFRATPGTPPLLVVDGDLSRSELASLYTACDVLVHPYRGEGFCLPVLEARACGLPVLATGGGATEALMDGPGATRIPSARRTVELPDPHVAMPWILEPSAADAGRLLGEVLADLPAQRAEARGFSRAVRAAFPWSAAAEALEQMAWDAMGRRRVPEPVAAPEVLFHAVPPAVPDPVPSVDLVVADEPVVTLPAAPAQMPAQRAGARS